MININNVRFVNLTSHAIIISTERGEMVIPPSGIMARAEHRWNHIGYFSNTPAYLYTVSKRNVIFYDTKGRMDEPPQVPGTYYIVSAQVLEILYHNGGFRYDFIAQATGRIEATRKENGKIDTVPGFYRLI